MWDKIQCVIQTYNQPATKELQQWIAWTKVDWRYSEGGYEIDVAKNRSVMKFLAEDVPRGKEYLLMIANDMVPMPTTFNILTEPGDLIYCQSMGNEGRLDHHGDKNFSAACWRGHAKVLQSFGPPWFRMGHTGDRTSQTYCDCGYFKDRAQEQGYDGRQVGIIGHEQRCILTPHGEDIQKWSMIWPSGWPLGDVFASTQPKTTAAQSLATPVTPCPCPCPKPAVTAATPVVAQPQAISAMPAC